MKKTDIASCEDDDCGEFEELSDSPYFEPLSEYEELLEIKAEVKNQIQEEKELIPLIEEFNVCYTQQEINPEVETLAENEVLRQSSRSSRNFNFYEVPIQFNKEVVVLTSIWGKFYGVIYKITDTSNGKVYIGQTIQNLRERLRQHLRHTSNKYLKRAFDSYSYKLKLSKLCDPDFCSTTRGEFTIETIKNCVDIFELNREEIKAIKAHRSHVGSYYSISNGRLVPLYGYNIDKGGGVHIYERKYLDKSEIQDLAKKGLFLFEIARELDTSNKTLRRNINHYWGMDYDSLLVSLGTKQLYLDRKSKVHAMPFLKKRIEQYLPLIDQELFADLISEGYGYDEVEMSFIKKLIYTGYGSSEIARKIGFYESKQLISRINNLFELTSFQEAKDLFYYKVRIIVLLKNQLSSRDLVDLFDSDYGKLKKPISNSGQGRKGIYNAMIRIWKTEYDEFYDVALQTGRFRTSDPDIKRSQFIKFYNYLVRIYSIYPKVDNEMINSLIDANTSPQEVDRVMLIIAIQGGKDLIALSNIFNKSYDEFRKWLKSKLSMSYNAAVDEYYWRPLFLDHLKDFNSAHAIDKIANMAGKSYQVTSKALKRVWNEDYRRFGNIRDLINYVQSLPFE